jgi:aerobic-type carbon monoxide dehydrogenase small subunit (CoxS/CutS family)
MMTIRATVNGAPVAVEIEPSEPLAHTLRARLGLTGTKVSCDVQACGACTVLVDGLPRSACTFLTYEARDRDVVTVEGIAPSDEVLHPLQQAFIDANAFQCGFCTSGMLVAAYALLASESEADDDELIEYMSGNICRCTGYMPIVSAILAARATLKSRPAGGRR